MTPAGFQTMIRQEPSYNALDSIPILKDLWRQISAAEVASDISNVIRTDIQVITSTFSRQATVAADKIIDLAGLLRSVIATAIPWSEMVTAQGVFIAVGYTVLTSPSQTDNLTLLLYTAHMRKWITFFHHAQICFGPTNHSPQPLLQSWNRVFVYRCPTTACVQNSIAKSSCGLRIHYYTHGWIAS